MNIFGFFVGLILGIVAIPIIFKIATAFGLYICIKEQRAVVYTLFGKVIGTIDEPGLNFPMSKLGIRTLLVPFFGKRYFVSTALRQSYLRDQMVNSEEGTPMGVGIWYEMRVSNPVDYLFVNANPEDSLRANVANATVSTLSNLQMEKMLENRHNLSRSVRSHVSPLSEKWGYSLGSVYIRKVAFTDQQMVHDITEKVVKRLVQVTSAMKQDGENRVGLIKSQTALKVSQELARASAKRPEVVGNILNEIHELDPDILEAVIDVVETEQLLKSKARISVVPEHINIMANLDFANSPNPSGTATSPSIIRGIESSPPDLPNL